MSLSRIYAVILRHLKPTFRDPIRYLDMFYWPLLDVFLWGFATVWLRQDQGQRSTAMLLTSLVLWQIVFRASIEVSRNLLEEIWNQNLLNLFATPLKISEWLIAILSISFIHSCWNLCFGSFVVYVIFNINVFAIGFSFVPLAVGALLFGWNCGFLASTLILLLGRRAEMICWSLPWLSSAFAAVFYPVAVLPAWIQKISWSLPATYVFENARYVIQNNMLNLSYVLYSFLLNAILIISTLFLFQQAFLRANNRGLATLD